MTSISIQVTRDFDILSILAGYFQTAVIDNRLAVPAHLGEGQIAAWIFPGDIQLYRFRFRLHTPLTIITDNPLYIELFTLFINLSENAPVNKTAGTTVENHTFDNGIVFFNPMHATTYCPDGQWFDFLLICLTQVTLAAYFQSNTPFSDRVRHENLFFIETSPGMSRILDEMIKNMDRNSFDTALSLHASVLNLILQIVKIASISNINPPADMRQEDLVNLLSVRNLLKSRLRNPPAIPEIARYCGCSESKLKITFKQVFGKSIYQYVQYLRMLEAQKLFLTGKFNISQVAEQVGYINLTHFSKAFEKHCGTKPAAFIKNNV